jgi:hypothetical protein
MDELGLGSRARDAGESVSATANRAATKVGDRMRQFAGCIRDSEARVGTAIHNSLERLAQKFDTGGAYFAERRYDETLGNIVQQIRRHPMLSVTIGVAAGLLLAKKTRRALMKNRHNNED